MKATELMVGDWVCLKDDIKCELPLKVDGVITDDISLDGEGFLGGAQGLIRPITITPEILEKNRFLPSFEMGHETLCLVSSEYSVYYRPVDTYLYVFKRDNEHGEGDFIVSDHRNKNAKYVHELQHALRLCGLNELANNFKV